MIYFQCATVIEGFQLEGALREAATVSAMKTTVDLSVTDAMMDSMAFQIANVSQQNVLL